MRFRIVWTALLAGMAIGCDRQEGGSTAPPAPGKPPVTLGVAIERVTPLPPDRMTHVAPTGSGLLFWVQEADGGGRETVFSMSDGGLPTATKFSNVDILEATGQAGGTGSIQSLEVGPDGRLYYYFAGGKGRQMSAAFGYFAPETGRPVVLADAATLARESRLGDSLALARGTIVRSGNVIWLWLRHPDGYALLSVEFRRAEKAPRRTFERVGGAAGEVRLTSMREDLAPGRGNALIYFDRATGRVWALSALGEASALTDLGDLPKETTAPSPDERGRLIVFAPEGNAIRDTPETPIVPTTQQTDYPALVILDGARRTTLGKRTMTAPATLNVRALSPQRLYRDRSGWLMYDAPTGELLRLKVVER